jgi:hypothetical protein
MKAVTTVLIFCLLSVFSFAQQKDSTQTTAPATEVKKESRKTKDTATKKTEPHSPRKATIRSALVPGWGQAYNRKYWKIPIVYGALGTCVGIFIYNVNEYTAARDAYRNKLDNDPANDFLIDAKFRPVDAEAVRQYRNAVRQNVDYSVLAFLICWGLNVVDATVDGHFKTFDINENLSLHVKPAYIPQTRQTNLGMVLTFGNRRSSK